MSQIKSKIQLKSKGDSANIASKDLVATMKWKSSVDLDLYGIYQTKDGREGKVYFASRGNLTRFPFMELDHDAGVGDTGGDNEENLRISKLDDMAHVLIVANIYAKSNARFSQYDGNVVVKGGSEDVEVPLTSKDAGNSCVICHIDNTGVAGPKLVNVNQTLRSLPTVTSFLNGEGTSASEESSSPRGFLGRLFGR